MTQPIQRVKADFFKTLAHPARIRILELLHDGERSVGELIPEVGIESSHLSQQLGILRRANILQMRKEGSAVLYSVTDRRMFDLLEVARAILTSSLKESSQLLAQLQAAHPSSRGGSVPGQHGPAGSEGGKKRRSS